MYIYLYVPIYRVFNNVSVDTKIISLSLPILPFMMPKLKPIHLLEIKNLNYVNFKLYKFQ